MISQPQSKTAPVCYICEGRIGEHYDPELGGYVCPDCHAAAVLAGHALAAAGLPHSSLTAPAWPEET